MKNTSDMTGNQLKAFIISRSSKKKYIPIDVKLSDIPVAEKSSSPFLPERSTKKGEMHENINIKAPMRMVATDEFKELLAFLKIVSE
jgi:hypothetical protein